MKHRLNFNIDLNNVIWNIVMEGFRIYNNSLKLRFGACVDIKCVVKF